jgi:hypothetical protein
MWSDEEVMVVGFSPSSGGILMWSDEEVMVVGFSPLFTLVDQTHFVSG